MDRTIRVAAIQLECKNGQIEANLKRAGELVDKAAQDGVQIVLLPELLAAGYQLTQAIWNCGEPTGGPSETWLSEMAKKHQVWVGATYLQADKKDFLNTFALAEPGGTILARFHKEKAAAVEAFFFRGSSSPHVIDTSLCRIGVSICYEGWLAKVVNRLRSEDADIVLMPLSAPTPSISFGFNQTDADAFTNAVRNVPVLLAAELGVPTVMANKVGKWRTASPKPFPPQDSSFPGLSAIVDARGQVLARLGDQEGVLVADLQIDPSQKKAAPPMKNKFARAVPRSFRLFAISEAIGRLSYLTSRLRRHTAQRISSVNGKTRRSTGSGQNAAAGHLL
jgi:predicted amidohydrolase